VPVPLIAKVPDANTQGTSELKYRYRHLGEFGLAINPTGELPSVLITVGIGQDKRTLVTLQHTQSGQPVTYRALDSLTGFDINLSEEEGQAWSEEKKTKLKGGYAGERAAWTEKDLTALLHAARALLDQLRDTATSGFSAVQQIQQELEQEIQTAAEAKNPENCPAILNKTQTLASAMLEAHLISPDGYQPIKADLDKFV